MNVVDSSGWLEYFSNGPNADFFVGPIEDVPQLIVPSPSIYEVFKHVLQQRGEGSALEVAAVMQQGMVVNLTASLALSGARLSIEKQLPMADSIMLATTRAYRAILWTQDGDFEDVEGVEYVKKKPSV